MKKNIVNSRVKSITALKQNDIKKSPTKESVLKQNERINL